MKDSPDLEPKSGKDIETSANKIDTGSPLSGISRAITDDELRESSGARKLLLYAYDKLERECADARDVYGKYHAAEKELSANAVKLGYFKRLSSAEDLCKVVGGAILGFSANHIETLQWIIIGGLAVLLIIGPFFYHHKMVKEDK